MNSQTSAITQRVSYAVFERDLATGHAKPLREDLIYSVAVNWAKGFNDDEAELARMELRDVNREFYPVRATTTFEAV
jgi:hypothetical protein